MLLIIMSLVVATYNVTGLGSDIKRKSIWQFLKTSSFQIILLQETHSFSTTERLWEMEWGGDILWSHGSTRSKGVAIAFKRGLRYSLNNFESDNNGRFLLAEITFENRKFCLVNVYGPNCDNPVFFDDFCNSY